MQFLTKREVSELLGVSERTVTRKVKEGKLTVKRKGKRVFFPKEQFENIPEKEQDTFDKVFETLQKQLDEKDNQIRRLQDQLREQGELVRNEQVISKGFQDKFLLLPEPKKTQSKTQKPEKKPEKPRKKPRRKVTKKKGFFEKSTSVQGTTWVPKGEESIYERDY